MKNRIAFVSAHASPLIVPGGVDCGRENVCVAETAKRLAKLGYEVDIFTRREDPTIPQIIEWMPSIRVIHIDAGPLTFIPREEQLPLMADFANSLVRFIVDEKLCYSLIHAHFFLSALVAADVKKILSIPFVVAFHSLGQVKKIHQGASQSFLSERIEIETRIAREADRIIAECPQEKEDLMMYYEADSSKIIVVPCGFSSVDFSPVNKYEAREFIGVEKDCKLLLQLGRMISRKGVDNVVSSLVYLKELAPSCKLIIVGGDNDCQDVKANPELAKLQNLASDLGVLDRVIFAGRKARKLLKYYYSAADVFITTPWYEPFGITSLESMACGTPVVGSNVGGIKYSVVDGKTGFLVPPRDPAALAAKVGFLLSNDDLLQRMSCQAVARVNALFTWKKVANMLSLIYDELQRTSEVAQPGVPTNSLTQTGYRYMS